MTRVVELLSTHFLALSEDMALTSTGWRQGLRLEPIHVVALGLKTTYLLLIAVGDNDISRHTQQLAVRGQGMR